MAEAYIYIVFSSTQYLIGKAIRKITGEPYNHMSIALDEDLEQMYSFARRHYHTPLYGGFVRESKARYCAKGQRAHIEICRLPVDASRLAAVKERLAHMYSQRDLYIYNHASAISALLRKSVKVRKSYTCVEFGVDILHQLDYPVTPGHFYTVCDVEKLLHEYAVYEGPIPQAVREDKDFFQKVPFPTLTTAREILKLIPRLGM